MTLHDREELVGPCLASLRGRAGTDFTLGVVANGCDYDPTPYLVGDHSIVVSDALGPARARNLSLAWREPGQDWVTVDPDVEFLTDDWLAAMQRTIHSRNIGTLVPATLLDGVRPFGGIRPHTGVHIGNNVPSGVRYHRGDFVDVIGAQRSYGPYGCEDLDYDERARAAGFLLAWDSDVVVSHPGVPSSSDWKRQELEKCLPCFKEWEKLYRAGSFLHEPKGDEDTPLPPRFISEEDWGSHLPYLLAAMELVPGPVLEVGVGIHSTPYIVRGGHVSVEPDPRWAAWARSQGAQVRADIPQGQFAVALIDGPTESRIGALEELRGRVKVFVVHDTEDPVYGYEPLLSTFAHRLDFDDKPRTTVVSDDIALDDLPTLLSS